MVDDHLRAKGQQRIFVIGDGAATQYSGMAQTAIGDGGYVAQVIAAEQHGDDVPAYIPKKPAFAIPAGPKWAVVQYGPLKVWGRLGWWLRRAADFHALHMLLPLGKTIRVYLLGEERGEME